LLSKESEEKFVSVYLPADANMALAVLEKVMKSRSRVNAIVGDKRLIRQWTTLAEAKKQVEVGAGVWKFASDENPDIVLAACGDYQTQEMLAARSLLKEKLPFLKIRFVNVNEVNVLGSGRIYANGLSNKTFEEIFTPKKDVIFSFHGYPSTIKQLLFDRPNNNRFDISGYVETGTTSTPFQILVMNKVSRYHIFMRVIEKLKKKDARVRKAADALTNEMNEYLKKHQNYIDEHGADPKEINEWEPMLKR
jgi:xylulose-5-phosphate/fructose-6-phosphate phosphoketolase